LRGLGRKLVVHVTEEQEIGAFDFHLSTHAVCVEKAAFSMVNAALRKRAERHGHWCQIAWLGFFLSPVLPAHRPARRIRHDVRLKSRFRPSGIVC
jgi:hypothetical protein